MGRIIATTKIDYYEPRRYRGFLEKSGPPSALSPRTKRMLALALVLYAAAFASPHITTWWLARQGLATPGPSLAKIILFTLLLCVVIVVVVWLSISANRLFRVRVRLTDHYLQRCRGSNNGIIHWKHASRAIAEVTQEDGQVWTTLSIHSTKHNHPLVVGVPDDQPIGPILQVLADHGVPVEITEEGAQR